MNIPPICLGPNTNLPNNIDIQSPFIFRSYKITGEHEGNTDFMVLAEFSEIEGPIPLLVIPSNIKPFIEINELVMNLMSTDYQCRGSNEFRIWNCTSLTLLNHDVGQFICAQYFILYDIRARGFVRPMCIAYCSTSLQKILTYDEQLEKEIWQAIEYLKICNLEIFKNELDSRIKDLIYTKKRLILSTRNSENKGKLFTDADLTSSISKSLNISSRDETSNSRRLNECASSMNSSVCSGDSVRLSSIMFVDSMEDVDASDEESILQHVTLDSLATQISDCQHIFSIVSNYLDSSIVQTDLESLKTRISKPNCALRRFFNSEGPPYQSRAYIPSVFVWSLVKRNYRNMRKIKDLSAVGYFACLLKLLDVVHTYSRPFTDLFFRDMELKEGFFQSSVTTLRMGVIGCDPQCEKTFANFSLENDFYDWKLVQILTTWEKGSNTTNTLMHSYNSDVTDSIADLVNIVESKVSLQRFKNEEHSEYFMHDHNFISFRLEVNWHILFDAFGQAIKSILYSVLCGKTVIVAGPETMEDKVAKIIDILSSILPFRPEKNFPVLRWHMGIVTKYHLSCYRIIGMCIPERLHLHDLMSNDTLNRVTVLNVLTNRISGVAYCGKYLQISNLFCKRNKSESYNSSMNSCFQTLIQNTLTRLGRDALLLTHFIDVTTRSDDHILKGLGIMKGDWSAVKYVSSLLRNI